MHVPELCFVLTNLFCRTIEAAICSFTCRCTVVSHEPCVSFTHLLRTLAMVQGKVISDSHDDVARRLEIATSSNRTFHHFLYVFMSQKPRVFDVKNSGDAVADFVKSCVVEPHRGYGNCKSDARQVVMTWHIHSFFT